MRRAGFMIAMGMILGACAGRHPPLETVDHVDLERFMGDWYVIAHIPTFIDDEAYNQVESYALNDDGTIATSFTFREGGFDGKHKQYEPKGFVQDRESNAVWGMRFVWPIKADYRIIYLDEDYETTVVGRLKRDLVWVMARQPEISDERYAKALKVIEEAGYDLSQLREVPQQW
jgi:apolipoprotein D and lipocalin family protein